jgi:hypothetical protein
MKSLWANPKILTALIPFMCFTLRLLAVQDPPPPRAVQDALLSRLAIELGRERDPAPISLDADGSGRHGVIYDRFTLAHATARAAHQSGAPLDPAAPPASLLFGTPVVIALPLACDARTVQPVDVSMDHGARRVQKSAPVTGAAIAKLVPGAAVPAGAMAVRFHDEVLYPGATIAVSYSGPVCAGSSNRLSFTLGQTEARAVSVPVVELAPGQQRPPGPVTVNLGGVVDLDGRVRYANPPETGSAFVTAAHAAALKMRLEPARMNRTPVPWAAGVQVTFPGLATAEAPPAAEGSTKDAPGLTPASSQCRASTAVTYGVSAFNPIRTGGGSDGLSRAVKYLDALRGPAGQGLRYRDAGQALGRGVMLQRFDLEYAGLAQPVRLYFDATREEPLFAPQGFLCAAPLGK